MVPRNNGSRAYMRSSYDYTALYVWLTCKYEQINAQQLLVVPPMVGCMPPSGVGARQLKNVCFDLIAHKKR